MVEWLEYPTPVREFQGSKPASVQKLYSVYSIAYSYVMINTPMTCLTLKDTVKSLMVGHKTTMKKMNNGQTLKWLQRIPSNHIRVEN